MKSRDVGKKLQRKRGAISLLRNKVIQPCSILSFLRHSQQLNLKTNDEHGSFLCMPLPPRVSLALLLLLLVFFLFSGYLQAAVIVLGWLRVAFAVNGVMSCHNCLSFYKQSCCVEQLKCQIVLRSWPCDSQDTDPPCRCRLVATRADMLLFVLIDYLWFENVHGQAKYHHYALKYGTISDIFDCLAINDRRMSPLISMVQTTWLQLSHLAEEWFYSLLLSFLSELLGTVEKPKNQEY